ncbi:MAG: hypothetical protein A2X48_17905 [Lentisphaerae bacterium GWF2_49_21]|nr:MAG: hypothetical protein A2X48_17905 [Lentisphaerae bacterium GWF2_49_21]
MFILRLPSAIVLTLLILSGIYVQGLTGKIIFTVTAMIFAFFAVLEFLDVISKSGRRSYIFFTSLFSALTVLLLVIMNSRVPSLLVFEIKIMIVFAILCWISLLFSRNREDTLDKALNSTSAFFLITLPLSFMVIIYLIDDGAKDPAGRKLLLYLLAVTKSGDIGAYLVGVTSSKLMPKGNHKIVPSISPKKSWEGTIGGLVFSIAVAIYLAKILPAPYKAGISTAVIIGTVLFICGFIGDLAESSLKRIAGVKDSGVVIPGIGGMLDLVDSLILNAPIYYIFLLSMMK